MQLAMLLLVVFMLAAYSFAFGIEYGRQMQIDEITPWNGFKPRFRLVYKNSRKPDRRSSR